MGQGASSANISRDLKPEELQQLKLKLSHSLGYSRFMRTLVCDSTVDNSKVLVKAYFKPPDSRLEETHQKVVEIGDLLRDVPNCLPWSDANNDPNSPAAFLIRPFIHTNLTDLLATPPFLTYWQRLWVTYQLLVAVRDAHAAGVVHGQVKTENVLVTSYGWVYLSDFAPFKPCYLPGNNPTQFSFFCDTMERRSCYLSPERFYMDKMTSDPTRPAPVSLPVGRPSESMDSFSVACVLVEVWTGRPLFTLTHALQYIDGEYSIDADLDEVACDALRPALRAMLSPEPSDRPACGDVLIQLTGTVFPHVFSSLWDMLSGLPTLPPDHAIAGMTIRRIELVNMIRLTPEELAVHTIHPPLRRTARPPAPGQLAAAVESDISALLVDSTDQTQEPAPAPASPGPEPSEGGAVIPGTVTRPVDPATHSGLHALVAADMAARLPFARLPVTKTQAIDMLATIAQYGTDEDLVTRFLPVVLGLRRDSEAAVAARSVRSVGDIVRVVTFAPPRFAPRHTLPKLVVTPLIAMLDADRSPLVRIAVGQHLPHIIADLKRITINTAHRDDEATPEDLEEIDSIFAESAAALVEAISVAPHPSAVRAILGREQASTLGALLGHRAKSMVRLLSFSTNFADYRVRAAFWHALAALAPSLGPVAAELSLGDLSSLGVCDPTPAVSAATLEWIATAVSCRVFGTADCPALVKASIPLVLFPCPWRRAGVVKLLGAVLEAMDLADFHISVLPIVRPYLMEDVIAPTIDQIVANLLDPISVDTISVMSNREALTPMSSGADTPDIPPQYEGVWPALTSFIRRQSAADNHQRESRDHASAELPFRILSQQVPVHLSKGTPLSPAVALSSFTGDSPAASFLLRHKSTAPSSVGSRDGLHLRSTPHTSVRVKQVIASLVGLPPGFRPKGVETDTLSTHSFAQTAMQVHPSGLYFVTAGMSFVPTPDSSVPVGQVCVWAIQPMSVSMPAPLSADLPHAEDAVTEPSCLALSGSQVLVGTTGGDIAIFDLEIGSGPSYDGISLSSMTAVFKDALVGLAVTTHDEKRTILALSAEGRLRCILADTREILWEVGLSPDFGYPTCMTLDSTRPIWVAVGTSGGCVNIIDCRFRAIACTLHIGSFITDMASTATGDSPEIFAAAGDSVWAIRFQDGGNWAPFGHFTVTPGDPHTAPAPTLPTPFITRGTMPLLRPAPGTSTARVTSVDVVQSDVGGEALVLVGTAARVFALTFTAPLDPTPIPAGEITCKSTEDDGVVTIICHDDGGSGWPNDVAVIGSQVPMVLVGMRTGWVHLFT
ncbi:Protein kinase domain [Carpediemonas membranifera]|uniref:non-specific serine/threonine protein kinase n=1 Tax=Carpediemonas membranifera TaxID=201153 RepID=A0A8J6BBW8_9EUKA|nr:Protein kinase domain [Carpediemonas membranifera]|eukprot:KAG9397037.1 Protein kinase domain [Carpediemonas membranifera]